MVSIGAEDIVDGNPILTLALIWTIIMHFQIQEIEIEVVSCGRTVYSWAVRSVHEHEAVGEGTAIC